MTFRKTILAATVLALPLAAPAVAQPVEGLYVGAGAGLNWLQEQRFGDPLLRPQTSYELGFGGVVSLGWGFGNGLRVEAEASYRQNGTDRVRTIGGVLPGTLQRPRGTASTYGFMVNAFYDFDLGWGLVPYVGAGVGWMWHNHDRVWGAWPPSTGASTFIGTSGTGNAFAYQAIAGLSLPIAEVPGLSLTAEYRFLGTLDQGLTVTERLQSTGLVVYSQRVSEPAYNHSLFLGVRYAFGVEPAPVPVAAPEPARTYLVFFDWDRDTLTDRARQIIADAAANSRRVQSTRIEVSGHADRSGSPQYNQALSLRRANNVAAELVRLGVPRNEIVVQAFGESRPLVPTADGVREPQNRRVEIVLR